MAGEPVVQPVDQPSNRQELRPDDTEAFFVQLTYGACPACSGLANGRCSTKG